MRWLHDLNQELPSVCMHERYSPAITHLSEASATRSAAVVVPNIASSCPREVAVLHKAVAHERS